MEQEQNIYKLTEEEKAAGEFELNAPDASDDEGMDELVLEQLGHFERTETEQFKETNQSLEKFIQEINEKFSGEDKQEIYDALMLMFTLHIYQKDRPEGPPYVDHPLAVAQKVLGMPEIPDKELVIAALMHDSVEDQGDKLALLAKERDEESTDEKNALSELNNKYGERVANIVSHLSNPDFDSILKSRGVDKDNPQYKELKNQLYAEHVSEAIQNPDVLIIKLADFSENILGLSKLPTETETQRAQKQKYVNKYLPVLKIFVERLQKNNLFPEYQEKLISEYQKYIK